jgi:hypothetical protein
MAKRPRLSGPVRLVGGAALRDARRLCGPAAGRGLALRNLAPKSPSVREQHGEEALSLVSN